MKITYNVRKRLWSKQGEAPQTVAKSGLTPRKVKLCVCVWLERNRSLRAAAAWSNNWFYLYCQQLKRLCQAIERKRPELINKKNVVFHYDNARPHISLATRQKLREHSWEVLMHPPYSSDLVPSDYLFQSLQNSLNCVKLTSKEACENHLSQFFQKSQKFYSDGIMDFTSKMAEDGRTRRHIFSLINFIIIWKKFVSLLH